MFAFKYVIPLALQKYIKYNNLRTNSALPLHEKMSLYLKGLHMWGSWDIALFLCIPRTQTKHYIFKTNGYLESSLMHASVTATSIVQQHCICSVYTVYNRKCHSKFLL